MQQETNLKERHDPRHCDLCDTGTRTLITVLVVLLIGAYIGIAFLLGKVIIFLTPMDPVVAYVVTYLGPPALILVAYPIIALIHLFRHM